MRRSRSHIGNIVEVIFIILYIISAIVLGVYFFIQTKSEGLGDSNVINPSRGDVKVDLIDGSGDLSLVGKILSFDTENDSASLYFEPGSVYHTKAFRIKNTGTLPIDYNITISVGDEKNAEEFQKAFAFWITTNPEDEGAEQPLLDYRGQLEPGAYSGCYYLVVAMRDHIGNEYQGKSFKGVGITVNAVELERSE